MKLVANCSYKGNHSSKLPMSSLIHFLCPAPPALPWPSNLHQVTEEHSLFIALKTCINTAAK